MPAAAHDSPGQDSGQDSAVVEAKRALRSRLVADRRSRPAAVRTAAASANARSLLSICPADSVICGFLPLPSEPLDGGVWDGALAAGCRVLLPVVTGAAPLDWVDYAPGSSLTQGALGIREPVGARLGQGAVATASLVVVPALAVDDHGFRLGRGAGHYDRTAALMVAHGGTASLVAVCFDEEVVPEVPHDVFDVRVDAVVTPSGGVRRW